VVTATGVDACSVAVGTVYNYSYTGAAQTFTAPCEGNYKVELWGAQGANDNAGTSGGKGAYVAGTVTLPVRVVLVAALPIQLTVNYNQNKKSGTHPDFLLHQNFLFSKKI